MRSPDLNAPRFRKSYLNIMNRELIAAFKAKYPEHSHYDDDVLLKALGRHNELITEEIQKNRDGVELPSNLGCIFIGMIRTVEKSRPNVAWAKSIKLGIMVRHKNWETDNKIGKIYYSNYCEKERFSNRHLWSFNPVRQFRKAASASILKNWKTYHSIEPHQYIWKLFETYRGRSKNKTRSNRELETYNEFNIED